MDDCPDPEFWACWEAGTLPDAERARWEGHLVSCASCRQDLASLAEALPAGRRSWLPYAAAAALLLSVGILWKVREIPNPLPVTVPTAAAAPALEEWPLGRTGNVILAPVSRGTRTGEGGFRLESGEAWAEAFGEKVRLSVAGWDGMLEMEDGWVALSVKPMRTSCLIASACAGEEAWGLRVLRGKARVLVGKEERTLEEGASLGSGAPSACPWAWVEGKNPGLLRDREEVFLSAGSFSSAEIRVRKRERAAEAAILFSAGGKAWQLPLGSALPADGAWVRLRLESRSGRVRILSGERTVLDAPIPALPSSAYSRETAPGFGLKVWGGDFEATGLRWR